MKYRKITIHCATCGKPVETYINRPAEYCKPCAYARKLAANKRWFLENKPIVEFHRINATPPTLSQLEIHLWNEIGKNPGRTSRQWSNALGVGPGAIESALIRISAAGHLLTEDDNGGLHVLRDEDNPYRDSPRHYSSKGYKFNGNGWHRLDMCFRAAGD